MSNALKEYLMEITLNDAVLKNLSTSGKLGVEFYQSLAKSLLATKEPAALAPLLLTPELALELLTARLQDDLAGTMAKVSAMPDRKGPAPRGRRRAKTRNGAKVAAKVAAKTKARKRTRVGAKKVDQLKEQVRAFLKANPGSGRKEIGAGVKMPSASIYLRLMKELKEAKEVKAKGEKRLTVYSLR